MYICTRFAEMKYALLSVFLSTVLLAVVSASVSANAGQFTPKAFFSLDAQGRQSHVHPVNERLLRRLRRQAFSTTYSSSSSSSSSSSNEPVKGALAQFASVSITRNFRDGANIQHAGGHVVSL